MKNETEYPFTAAQYNALGEAERQAVLAVAEYLTSSTTEITDEDLSMALNLMLFPLSKFVVIISPHFQHW